LTYTVANWWPISPRPAALHHNAILCYCYETWEPHFLEPSGPVNVCNGIALPLPLPRLKSGWLLVRSISISRCSGHRISRWSPIFKEHSPLDFYVQDGDSDCRRILILILMSAMKQISPLQKLRCSAG